MAVPRRKIIVSVVAGLVLMGTWTGVTRAGIDPLQSLTEARCRSGAFVNHSANVGFVEADAEQDSSVAHGNDNYSLAQTRVPTVSGANLITNGGLETLAKNKTILKWNATSFGTNKVVASTVAGYKSPTAVRLDMSEYVSGGADWYYPAVAVTPGAYYQFRDYYRSNVGNRAILVWEDAAGKSTSINLNNASASTEWTSYTVEFFMPLQARKATVIHSLSTDGWLETDDYSIQTADLVKFNQPMVSLTFDDGWKSIHDNALPLMQKYGVVSTQYIITGFIGQAKSYVSPGDVYDLRDSGHEIASHTVDHTDLTTLNSKYLSFEMSRSKSDLAKCYSTPTSFAAPYGTYNASTMNVARSLYTTARSTAVGYNTADSIEPYNLKVQNVDQYTTQAELQEWLTIAKTNGAWLILVYHQIDDSKSDYARTKDNFESDLKTITDSGVTVRTVRDAYDQVIPQLQ